MLLKTIYDEKKQMLNNNPNDLIHFFNFDDNIIATISDYRTIHLEFKNELNINAVNTAVFKWGSPSCSAQLIYSLLPLTNNTYLLKI